MTIVYIVLAILVTFIVSLNIYIRLNPQFGGRMNSDERHKFSKSNQWNGKVFENTVAVNMSMGPLKMVKIIFQSLTNRKARAPKSNLEVKPFNSDDFLNGESSKFIWYGHSVVLLRMSGQNILIDPMFGDNASPIAPFKTKRFSDNTLNIIDSLPEIDILCMSHDHYDHLDYKSILKLKSKTKHFYVALGIKRHLTKWSIEANRITELDWNSQLEVDGLKIIFTETQHFSGRGLSDRFKSLWGGWIIKSDTKNVYWSGDSGFGKHFSEIGDKYGPFDVGFMECGQYNENWPDIHMTPEESVQASINAKVSMALPVHNNGFALAMHSFDEPYLRFKAEAALKSQNMMFPEIGEVVEF